MSRDTRPAVEIHTCERCGVKVERTPSSFNPPRWGVLDAYGTDPNCRQAWKIHKNLCERCQTSLRLMLKVWLRL